MKTKIYGGSDDLIEIEGEISDEVNVYLKDGEKIKFSVSDGTAGTIEYDENGEWRIKVLNPGKLISKNIKSVGEDNHHTDEARGCTSYSDVLIFDEGIEWVKIGRKTYKK